MQASQSFSLGDTNSPTGFNPFDITLGQGLLGQEGNQLRTALNTPIGRFSVRAINSFGDALSTVGKSLQAGAIIVTIGSGGTTIETTGPVFAIGTTLDLAGTGFSAVGAELQAIQQENNAAIQDWFYGAVIVSLEVV